MFEAKNIKTTLHLLHWSWIILDLINVAFLNKIFLSNSTSIKIRTGAASMWVDVAHQLVWSTFLSLLPCCTVRLDILSSHTVCFLSQLTVWWTSLHAKLDSEKQKVMSGFTQPAWQAHADWQIWSGSKPCCKQFSSPLSLKSRTGCPQSILESSESLQSLLLFYVQFFFFFLGGGGSVV